MVVDDDPYNIQAILGLMSVLKMKNIDEIDVCYNGEESCKLIEKAI